MQYMLYSVHTAQIMYQSMLYTLHTLCASPCCTHYTAYGPVHAVHTTHLMDQFMLYMLYTVHTWCTSPCCTHYTPYGPIHAVHCPGRLVLVNLLLLLTPCHRHILAVGKPEIQFFLNINIHQICFIPASHQEIHFKEVGITDNPYFYAAIILIPSLQ